MSRKPIDQLAASQKPQGQDGVWAFVRKKGIGPRFTVAEICRETDINKRTVQSYLQRLSAADIVREHVNSGKVSSFELIVDQGRVAPRIRKDGSPVDQGKGTANMWRSMRMMDQFTWRDLAIHSTTDEVSISENTALSYCSVLLKAGYLRVLQRANRHHGLAIYRLINNTGPKPPMIQRSHQVFDPNLKQVVYPIEGEA